MYRPSEALPLVPSSPPRRRGTLLGQSRRGTRCCRPGRRRRRRRPRGWSRTRTRSRRGGRRCPGRSSEAADAAFPKFDASQIPRFFFPRPPQTTRGSCGGRRGIDSPGDGRAADERPPEARRTPPSPPAAVLSTACVRTRVCHCRRRRFTTKIYYRKMFGATTSSIRTRGASGWTARDDDRDRDAFAGTPRGSRAPGPRAGDPQRLGRRWRIVA